MPTNSATKRKRYLAAGHFDESIGYAVDRPSGCHDWLLILTLRGNGQFTHSGGTLLTNPHDVVLIAPNTSHRYEAAPETNRWELLWSHFLPRPDWAAWLKWQGPAPGWGCLQVTNRSSQKQIAARFKDLVQLAEGYRHHREALALNALEAVLLQLHEQVVAQRGQATDSRIIDVLDYICRQLNQPLTVEELARGCHLSPSRFAHLFREQMDMTPQQFVERQRIERARELLEHTGYTIAAIAKQVGFESPFYFSRRFKQMQGFSPSEFRRRLV